MPNEEFYLPDEIIKQPTNHTLDKRHNHMLGEEYCHVPD